MSGGIKSVDDTKIAILIIEDEEVVRVATRGCFTHSGFKVFLAQDGREGVELFRQHADEISVVLLDQNLPKLSGTEAFHELRAIQPTIRVILTTGYDQTETLSRLGKKPLVALLQKPYRFSQLVQTVQDLLACPEPKPRCD